MKRENENETGEIPEDVLNELNRRIDNYDDDPKWLIARTAFNMDIDIYEYVLSALATFIMAQNDNGSGFTYTCLCLSVEKATVLGVTDYRDPDGDAYDILPRLKELYIQGHYIKNDDTRHLDWRDWWDEVKDFIPHLSM